MEVGEQEEASDHLLAPTLQLKESWAKSGGLRLEQVHESKSWRTSIKSAVVLANLKDNIDWFEACHMIKMLQKFWGYEKIDVVLWITFSSDASVFR